MKKILFLPIETIARELDAKLLLTHRALSRGYSVVIGQKNNVFKAAEKLGYGIYLYKSHERSNFPKSNNLGMSDYIYTALDEEGLVFLSDKAYIARAIPNKIDHLKIVFTWGQYQCNLLIKENPSLKSKIYSVGNPRFDLLRPEFLPLYKSTVKKLSSTWGRYVLINTNFSAGNFSRHYGCDYMKHNEHLCAKMKGRTLLKSERDYFIKEEKYYKKLFYQYREMIMVLSSKFPDLNFILRPHPTEDHKNWEEALEGLQNVHTIFEGSVVNWIQGSIAVIHTGCTTGIESWALHKPVIVYNPSPEKGIEPELPNRFGINIKNISRICKVLENIISGRAKNTFDEQIETAHLFVESIKGELSAERIMYAYDNILDKHKIKSQDLEKSVYIKLQGLESRKRALKFMIVKFLRKHQSGIRKLTGKKISDYIYNKFQKYPGLISQFQKFPGLSSKFILNKLIIFDSIFKKKSVKDYLIRKIATDTYIIDRR